MKNWTTLSNLATLSLGALLSACGAVDSSANSDQSGLESVDPSVAADQLGEDSAALTACDDPQYDHWRYISGLGVAAANELRRWNIADFTNNNGVQLSATGLARCTNGCPNIQAILSLQNNGTGTIPRLDSKLLKQYLVGFYNDQVSWQNVNGFNEHELVPSGVGPANCGYRYSFRDTLVKKTGTTAIKSVATSKCVDIASSSDQANIIQKACNASTQQTFVVDPVLTGGYRLKNSTSGKCAMTTDLLVNSPLKQQNCGNGPQYTFDMVDVGAGKFQLKSYVQSFQAAAGLCVEIAGSSQSDGAQLRVVACNATSAAQQFTATLVTKSFDNPNQSNMINYLRFVGGNTQNPYIQFQSNAQNVSMDPMGTMVDGGSTGQSAACVDASSAFDATRAINGKCCLMGNKYGKFSVTAWNASLFYCK